MMQLYSRSTDTEITVWWEKVGEAPEAPEAYGVIVNGEEICRVEKTHATVRNLQPDTLYRIRIEPLRLEINISNCQNIWISGLLLKNAPSWNVHMVYSDQVVTNGCRIYSRGVWNGDGWDPDSSTNCTVFDTVFETGDDGIAIKSGKNPEGNRIGRPTEHIRIFDCRYESGGGIAIGSEMSGGISDVCIWDCDMGNTRCGIIVKGTEKRGGYIRDIHARDSRVSGIRFQSVTYNDDGEAAPCPPVCENCSFTGMYLTDTRSIPSDYEEAAPAIELRGFGHKGHGLKDIVFRDIVIGNYGAEGVKKIAMECYEGISLWNICTEMG